MYKLTISTQVALLTPPAFSKAQGKLRSPAPSADFSMMKTAPKEPRRGASVPRAGLYSRLMLRMLSRASSSMLPRAQLSTPGIGCRERGGGMQPDGDATGDTEVLATWVQTKELTSLCACGGSLVWSGLPPTSSSLYRLHTPGYYKPLILTKCRTRVRNVEKVC